MSRKIGRPPRISRESVLVAAVEVAGADAAGAISIGAIARHLKVTPMAIYTYFASKDDLLQALSERLLDGFEVDFTPEAAPLERIRLWAMRVRRHFLANPPLIHMLAWEGGHNSVAWLNTSAPLLEAIGEFGLDDDTFAQTVLWTWSVVLGAVQFEIYDRRISPRLSEEEFARLSAPVRSGIGKVDAFLRREPFYAGYFDFQVDRLIDALAQLQLSASADTRREA